MGKDFCHMLSHPLTLPCFYHVCLFLGFVLAPFHKALAFSGSQLASFMKDDTVMLVITIENLRESDY